MDSDPVGRLASTMLERVVEYEVTQFNDFDSAMRGVVEDRLLPGRGTAWVRYEPIIVNEQPEQTGMPELNPDEGVEITNTEEIERVDSARVPA